MIYRFIEATDGTSFNHGKFMVGKFSPEDWSYRSTFYEGPLLRHCGWGPEHVMVMDLQTGEGVIVRYGGVAKADLDKHRVWVCPMFEPFLAWLYTQDLGDVTKLPETVNLGDVPTALSGYRRAGGPPTDETE